MDKVERKKLVAKGAENKRIAEAEAEERRILQSKPVLFVPNDPRLANLPKAEAIKIIHARTENLRRFEASNSDTTVGEEKEAPKEETAKKETPAKEVPAKKETKKSRGKKKVD